MLLSGAMLMIAAFGAAPERALSASAANARVSVHDPSIMRDFDGTYYVFGSHIETAASPDLKNWTRISNGYATQNNAMFGDLSRNLAKAFAWAGEDLEDCAGGFAVWAPDVYYDEAYINADGSLGAYLMYFCTSSTYKRSVIAFAASKTVRGPYQFVDTLIYSGFTENDSFATSATKNVNRKYTSTNIDELIAAGQVTYNSAWFNKGDFNNRLFPNAIDPTIYRSTDGKMYMCYGSWSGGIFTLEIDPRTGYVIHPESGTTADGRMIDSYFGTQISGGVGKSGEGPFIEYNADTGFYYLWVTYGGLTAEGGYNMRVFRSQSPTGPFTDPAGRAAVLNSSTDLDSVGLKVMGNYQFSTLKNAYMAEGHNSVLRDDDGSWYLVYHTRFNAGTEYHEVRVHSMYFNKDGWPVVAPNEYAGERICVTGYNVSDIVGTYEYINHGSDTSKTIHGYQTITLNADGTVSGAVSGTWKQDNSSSACEIRLDRQSYRGYFLAAPDETGRTVMSFTAVGDNNRTVWGAKTEPYTGSDRVVVPPESDVIADGVYTIKNINSGLYIAPDAAGNVYQTANAADWTLRRTADGWYTAAAADGTVMTVDGAVGTNGCNIALSPNEQSTAQKFILKQTAENTYAMLTLVSNGDAGLDVYEISLEEGANICQWEYWGGKGQQFILARIGDAEIAGDVNGDGSFSLADLIALHRYLLRLETDLPNRKAADVSGDGILTAVDLSMLKAMLLAA